MMVKGFISTPPPHHPLTVTVTVQFRGDFAGWRVAVSKGSVDATLSGELGEAT